MSPTERWSWGEPIEVLRQAVAAGRLLAIPTESSYGLAVDPRNEEGVHRIYRLKSRTAGKPLPVVIADASQLEALGARLEDARLERLARRWPAPLALRVRLLEDLPAAAGSGWLAVRVPGHDRLRSLLSCLGGALTATSANRSGHPALTDPEAVCDLLEQSPGSILIDDGPLAGGQPSTLVGIGEDGIEILRPGRIGLEEIDRLLGRGEVESFSAASVEILADESR